MKIFTGHFSTLINGGAVCLAIGLAMCITSCINDNESHSGQWTIETGAKLPDFTISMNTGEVISTGDLAKKQAVIVFFSTDCGDCRRELPKLQAVYSSTCDEYVWMAIGRDQNSEEAVEFWAANELTIPYSAQPDREIYTLFATSGIPRMYIVKNLTIVQQFGPDKLPDAETLFKALE